MADVNMDRMRRIAALRSRTRDLEVIWALDELVRIIGEQNSKQVPAQQEAPPTARIRGARVPIKAGQIPSTEPPLIPAAVADEFEQGKPEQVGVPGDAASQDRKAYMREYMRKKRAEKKGGSE